MDHSTAGPIDGHEPCTPASLFLKGIDGNKGPKAKAAKGKSPSHQGSKGKGTGSKKQQRLKATNAQKVMSELHSSEVIHVC